MDNGHEVMDSIPTITVTEERQKIVTTVSINKFALVGMFIGTLMLAGGIILANFSTGVLSALGPKGEMIFGYSMSAIGIFMFCFFGMNARTTEIHTEPYVVEKQIPIDGIMDRQSEIRKREELIDTKVNAMTAVFEKLAILTSEIEEKLINQETARIQANEEKEARLRLEEEERRKRERTEENERLIASYARREENLRSEQEELNRQRASQNEASERLRAEKEQFARSANESKEQILSERKKLAEEMQRAEAEKEKTEEELMKTRQALLKRQEQIEENIRQFEEQKKADEEARQKALRLAKEAEEKKRALAAKKVEEIRIMKDAGKTHAAARAEAVKQAEAERLARKRNEEMRKEEEKIQAEKDRFKSLGLSASAYAWSSELRNNEQ